MFLLDSNIVIYQLQRRFDVFEFLGFIGCHFSAISIVTRLEVLLGERKEKLPAGFLEDYLDEYENIDLDRIIVREAVFLQSLVQTKMAFKDLIIAATAKVYGKTVVTADKDFLKLKGVKVKLYKPRLSLH